MMNWNSVGVGWVLYALFLGLFWGAVVWGTAHLVRRERETSHRTQSGDKLALDALQERLASGEIDNDEFRERREALLKASSIFVTHRATGR